MSEEHDKQYKRKQKYRKIEQRVQLIKDTAGTLCLPTKSESLKHLLDENNRGKLAKSHCGYLGDSGQAQKTKIKNSHCPYRCKGSYGKTIQYKRHDKRQVQDMEQQINEYRQEQ